MGRRFRIPDGSTLMKIFTSMISHLKHRRGVIPSDIGKHQVSKRPLPDPKLVFCRYARRRFSRAGFSFSSRKQMPFPQTLHIMDMFLRIRVLSPPCTGILQRPSSRR